MDSAKERRFNELTIRSHQRSFGEITLKYGTIFALVLVFVFFSVASNRFLNAENLLNVLTQIANLAIVSLGMTAAMAAGEIDMTVGSAASLSGVVVTSLLVGGFSLPVAILAAIMIGVVTGMVNGLLTTLVRIPSIIVTLGVSSILVGFVFMITHGKAVYGSLPDSFSKLGNGHVGPISNSVIIMAVFIIISFLVLNKTIIGRYIYAVGGNPIAANLSGISTSKYRIISLMISGIFATVAGVLLASRLGSGQPAAGTGFTLDALSAVFIGFTTIRIGRPNVIGTLIGVALIGIMNNGLTIIGLDYYFQNMAKGAIMIAAVAFAASRTELKIF